MKYTYKDSALKKAVREDIFTGTRFQKLVGLGGPDLREYVTYFRQKGFGDITVWENNGSILLRQLPQMQGLGISYHFGDILHAPYHKDVLYDLDFCSSIMSTNPHMAKFRDNFVLTVALRPIGLENTVDWFILHRGEVRQFYTYDGSHGRFSTDKGEYGIRTYYDRATTYRMAMIYPLSIYSQSKEKSHGRRKSSRHAVNTGG